MEDKVLERIFEEEKQRQKSAARSARGTVGHGFAVGTAGKFHVYKRMRGTFLRFRRLRA